MVELTDDMIYNLSQQLKTKEISTEVKGEFVKQVCAEKKISQREYGRRYDVPHSTVHDWTTQRQMKKYYAKKENELDVLLERLVFLLKKEPKMTPKTVKLLDDLHSEMKKFELQAI